METTIKYQHFQHRKKRKVIRLEKLDGELYRSFKSAMNARELKRLGWEKIEKSTYDRLTKQLN